MHFVEKKVGPKSDLETSNTHDTHSLALLTQFKRRHLLLTLISYNLWSGKVRDDPVEISTALPYVAKRIFLCSSSFAWHRRPFRPLVIFFFSKPNYLEFVRLGGIFEGAPRLSAALLYNTRRTDHDLNHLPLIYPRSVIVIRCAGSV